MPKPQTLYKLIILYMLDKVRHPLTNSQISNFILDHDYTSYFHLQETITDMVGTQLISVDIVRDTSYYKITEEGATTLSYFTNEISGVIKEEIHAYLEEHGVEMQNRTAVMADYYKNTTEEYCVRCQVKERNTNLIDLTLSVPTEEAARSICQKWDGKCQEIYAYLMNALL